MLEQPNDDKIDECEEAINIGKQMDHPKAQIAQEIINQVKNNFRTYEDTDVFQSEMPASYTKVIDPSLTNENASYPDDALTP